MKVLFVSRASLYQVKGGDTIQMEQTAANLRRLGLAVDIKLAGDRNIAYDQYDLMHAFNIIRPSDLLFHLERSNLPLVLSPIYLEYGAASNEAYHPLLKWLMNKAGAQKGEYLKNLGRAILKNEPISFTYFYRGQSKSIAYILSKCAMLLPNSESEYKRLKRDFPGAGAYKVVPNSVDTAVFNLPEQALQARNHKGILCAARFEPRKNQLNVIQALNNTDFQVTFVGAPAPQHYSYYHQCKAAAASNIRFIDFLPQQQLAALYQSHKVHILASWFETTGLSSLEAAACGCNIVISACGDTEDYFGTDAYYCDPGDHQSILQSVQAASIAPLNESLFQRIQQNFTWQKTAEETLMVYQKVLNK